MKIEVTEKGVYDAKGKMIEVGSELTINGDEVPAWLVNKGRVIAEKPAKAVAVTNPDKTKKRIGLEAQAEAAGIAHDGVSDDDLIAAIKAAKAA